MDNKDIAKQVRSKLKPFNGSTLSMKDAEFDNFICSLNKEELSCLLSTHRSDRDFYKKITQEDYRKKNPKSKRYREADSNVEILNSQGKKIKSMYDFITNNGK
jgi:hypothetical protein